MPWPRTAHRWIGVLLLVPILVWTVTGLLFHIKPGWSEAYGSPAVEQLPIELAPESIALDAAAGWLELRRLRTVIGPHLLVRDADGWHQLDPVTRAPRPEPGEHDRRRLFDSAFQGNPQRYGSIATIDGWDGVTTTGVEVSLNWNTLRLRQRGADTAWIDWLYRMHYLQWTGTTLGDRVLPMVGLAALMLLAMFGLRLLFQ